MSKVKLVGNGSKVEVFVNGKKLEPPSNYTLEFEAVDSEAVFPLNPVYDVLFKKASELAQRMKDEGISTKPEVTINVGNYPLVDEKAFKELAEKVIEYVHRQNLLYGGVYYSKGGISTKPPFTF